MQSNELATDDDIATGKIQDTHFNDWANRVLDQIQNKVYECQWCHKKAYDSVDAMIIGNLGAIMHVECFASNAHDSLVSAMIANQGNLVAKTKYAKECV